MGATTQSGGASDRVDGLCNQRRFSFSASSAATSRDEPRPRSIPPRRRGVIPAAAAAVPGGGGRAPCPAGASAGRGGTGGGGAAATLPPPLLPALSKLQEEEVERGLEAELCWEGDLG